MAYSELIKNFERIRDYMRQFYVYGFKSRDQYDSKSARSYDNERRRIESYLGEYMSFRNDSGGKRVFISVDSRKIAHNPIYKAFKAKSFTNKDITLNFYIMDILAEKNTLTVREIAERINDQYLSHFENAFSLDESTVYKKLKEYEGIGIISSEKKGREVFYSRNDCTEFDLKSWKEALAFYSEENPLGVIGSFIMDKTNDGCDIFRFKHHYILHALDSDILCLILKAIDEKRALELTAKSPRNGRDYVRTVCPLKIYISTQSGRQYLLGYHYKGKQMTFLRMDAIKKAVLCGEEKNYDKYLEYYEKFSKNLWGVSEGEENRLDHIEMTLHIEDGESFIVQRLKREKRCGSVEVLDEHTCLFTADVYDAAEMLPWIRTFIGRIENLRCSNKLVADTFYEDLKRMNDMYGGDEGAV